MTDVNGAVAFHDSIPLREVTYSLARERRVPHELRFTFVAPSEALSLNCVEEDCVLRDLTFENIGTYRNEGKGTTSATIGTLQLDFDDIVVEKLTLWGLPHTETLSPFHALTITDSVLIAGAPALLPGAAQELLNNLASRGFEGEFMVCDGISDDEFDWGEWAGVMGWGEPFGCQILEPQ